MPENMSISVNGQSQVPPGFRFHPTEEELLQYYLKKKVSNLSIDLDVIRDVDLNKLEPWDIQEKCKIGTTPQNDWYFFSHKDKKYPTGTRTNRATAAGFWKATGRDKVIFSNCRRIGMRKTLVFYKGRAPHGQKSDWIMHEYRLDDNTNDANVSAVLSEVGQEEGWVVCRIFKKKNHHKTLDSPVNSSITSEAMRNNQMMMFDSCNEGALEQIFQYMGRSRSCKEENLNNGGYPFERFSKLPSLESPNSEMIADKEGSTMVAYNNSQVDHNYGGCQMDSNLMITNWATLDRLVASQLNGQISDPAMDAYCTNQDHDAAQILSSVVRSSSSASNKSYRATPDHYTNEMELWSFARSSSSLSSSDPLCHVSEAPL